MIIHIYHIMFCPKSQCLIYISPIFFKKVAEWDSKSPNRRGGWGGQNVFSRVTAEFFYSGIVHDKFSSETLGNIAITALSSVSPPHVVTKNPDSRGKPKKSNPPPPR